MKVISGLYKGRKIEGYDMEGTRPTMDRVKESLFAIIQNSLDDAIVLDLFSGSGNLAIESLSEGAKYAYAVDYNRKAINTINNNLKTIGITNCKPLNMEYQKALSYLKDNDVTFDLIFLDPPYKTNYIEKSIELIDKYKLLKPTGKIVCESSSLDKIIYSDNFNCTKDKKYGDKYVVILEQI